jgi:site-specific recombinase XerD
MTRKNPQNDENRNITSFPRLEEFCAYFTAVKGRSPRTIREYRYDLTHFFRFLKRQTDKTDKDTELAEIDISDIDDQVLKSVSVADLYAFISYLASERKNSPAARSRRISTLRAFFHWLHDKAKVTDTNIAAQLENPKQLKKQPRYLSLEESRKLLKAADQKDDRFSERDYLILTMFLNCGMRLSELVGINLKDIRGDTLVVLGKGGKERTIYLNDACMVALRQYLDVRRPRNTKEDALFISRLGTRLGARAVQNVIKKYLAEAGLDTRRYSVHKLRHTAATLMYQHGNVDLRSLQTILGHESVATTEIYTHLNADRLHKAVESNPLSAERPSEE